MEWIRNFFQAEPLAGLFTSLALGYLVGKLRIGKFVLGGIAGTLLVGVLIGQFDIPVDASIETIAFALFIYAVGYQGGPQFIRSLNLQSLNQLTSAFLMTFVGLMCVLGAAWWFDLDRGTAAGLAAGGLTQSAIIGTADAAIARLDVSPAAIKTMQTNVAVGYAVCYIFGSLGPIIVVSWLLPMIMRWDVRKEALALAKERAGGNAELEPGQFNGVQRVSTRFFQIDSARQATGRTVLEIDKEFSTAAVVAIVRSGKAIDFTEEEILQDGDIVAVIGEIPTLKQSPAHFGPEVEAPPGMQVVEENRELIMNSGEFAERTMAELSELLPIETRHGVFVTGVKRRGQAMPCSPELKFHKGDALSLVGRPEDVGRVARHIGPSVSAAAVTDFVFFGVGMTLGFLIGMIEFKLVGVPVTIGSGVGCLLSGLFFGWLRSVHPRFAALPSGASNFLRDFGLAVFVALVGITAAPQAFTSIKENGMTLLLLGASVTLIPQIVVFFFSYYILRIRSPIVALACVVGGRSANPGFAALLEKAGNSTPVATFTITYALANIFLTIWGPIVVGFVGKNVPMEHLR